MTVLPWLPRSILSIPESLGKMPVGLSFGDVIAASRILLLSFWSTLHTQDSLLELFFSIHLTPRFKLTFSKL